MNAQKQALALAKKGFRVFPLPQGETIPLVKFSKVSTKDPEKILNLWRSETSKKNIGVHTGDGLIVVDVDAHHEGYQSLVSLLHENEPLPDTYCVKTPSGGAHYYFTTDVDIRNSQSLLGKGIDIRGHNGFVVAAESVREQKGGKKGGKYVAINNLLPAKLPIWIIDMISQPNKGTADKMNNTTSNDQPQVDIPEGERNTRLFKEAAALRGKGAGEQAIRAYVSARNGALTNPLPERDIDTIVQQAAKYEPNSTSLQDIDWKKELVKVQKKEKTAFDKAEFTLDVTPLSTFTPRKIFYLWNGWFPLSSVSILAGDPGQAKTSFLLNIAAAVSKGRSPIPNGPEAPLGNILFATAEDSIEHTVLPRVLAAEGNPARFHVLNTVNYDILEHYTLMSRALKKIGNVRLLIIDPITAFMSHGADGNSNVDVRVTLRALSDLAEENNLAVVGISHLNKDTRKSAIARLLGSIGWVAAPRAVYLANADPEEPGRSVVACAKTNFEPPTPLAFKKRVVDVNTVDGAASQIVIDTSDYDGELSLDELFAPKEVKRSRYKIDDAHVWLKKRMFVGEWVQVSKLMDEVEKECDFGWRTVNSAKKRLVIKTKRLDGAWLWMRLEPGLQNEAGENDE